jgi:hypothetical protein
MMRAVTRGLPSGRCVQEQANGISSVVRWALIVDMRKVGLKRAAKINILNLHSIRYQDMFFNLLDLRVHIFNSSNFPFVLRFCCIAITMLLLTADAALS